jgi:hypothetical protein
MVYAVLTVNAIQIYDTQVRHRPISTDSIADQRVGWLLCYDKTLPYGRL